MRNGVGLFLLFVLVVSAGCSGLSPADTDVPTGSEARDGYATFQSVEGTVEYRYQSAEDTSNTTVRVVKRPKQRMTRQEFLSPPDLAGDETVTNGSVYWLYDASENTVTRTSLGESTPSNTSNVEFVQQVFSNLTGSGDDSVVTDPPLPVGPLSTGGDSPGVTTADVVGPTQFTVEYAGTETVAGRPTHAVELAPVNGTGVDTPGSYIENATYWFDAEYFSP
jgi:outer membrane lipoprotein-sorting protein